MRDMSVGGKFSIGKEPAVQYSYDNMYVSNG